MAHIFTLTSALLFSATLFAQTFSSPESVEYDAANNRWIVGQNGANRVDTYSPGSGTLTSFGTTISSGPHGIEVLGSVAYVCDGGRVRGYDLANGNEVFNVNLSATFLNGITSDGGYFLFVTDFTAKKIYRVNTLTNSFNLMCNTVKTPNGIYYDGANNRCVFVTWGSAAAIQAMSLADSTVSTLYTTAQSNIDGITRDLAGYWYYTAWSNNSLMRIDPNFSTTPVAVMTGLSSPADIDINAAGDSIGIPNSGSANNVVFYTGITTGIPSAESIWAGTIYPSIAIEGVMIELVQPVDYATVSVFDANGRMVRRDEFGGFRYFLRRNDLAEGTYILIISDENGVMMHRQQVVFTGE